MTRASVVRKNLDLLDEFMKYAFVILKFWTQFLGIGLW